MATWKKVIVSGSDASLNSVQTLNGASITGSLKAANTVFLNGLTNVAQSSIVGIDAATGQLYYQGTGSFTASSASFATSASYAANASNAVSASHAVNADSAISAATASSVGVLNQPVVITGSLAINTTSGTALNINADTFVFTGSFNQTGSVFLTGLTQVSKSFVVGYDQTTGQLTYQTAVDNADTASFAVSASYALTASYVETAQTASYVETAQTASFVQTAQTASFINPLNQNVSIVGDLNVTGSTALSGSLGVTGSQNITGSLAVDGGTALTGSLGIQGTVQVSGSLGVTGSTAFSGSVNTTGSQNITGSLAVDGLTSLTGSLGIQAGVQLSGSLGVTGSSAFSGSLGITGSQVITGSLAVDGLTSLSGSLGIQALVQLTGSLGVTGSTGFLGNVNVTGSVSVLGGVTASAIQTNAIDSVGGVGPIVINAGQATNAISLVASDAYGVQVTGSLKLGAGGASGSFSGSFAGDGSGLTGVVATAGFALTEGAGITDFSYNGGTSGITVAVSGAADLATNVVTKWSGAAFVTSSITDSANVTINNAGGVLVQTGGLYVTGSSTFHDNVFIEGNLTVAGTASFQNSTNLAIADQFILLNSGSATFQDSGFVINTGNTGNSGSAFFLETAGTTTGTAAQNGRFAIAGSVQPDATSVTAEEYANTTKIVASSPTTEVPQFGGTGLGQGNMWVDTTNGDIFIYA